MSESDLRARLTALYEKYRGQGVEYASWGDDLLNDLAALLREPPADAPLEWQPIDTAPKDRTIIGALIRDGRVWRVHEMKHNGLAFYTVAGGSLPQMTHWIPMPEAARAATPRGPDPERSAYSDPDDE